MSNINLVKFSVLMSIYYGETSLFFDRAMKSIWEDQTRKPDQIVLVKDGELPYELNKTIEFWKAKLGRYLNVVDIKTNVGLGDALNVGLRHCKFELVARMDSDDISLPSRFEQLLEVFADNDVSVCGSWINEFDTVETTTYAVRRTPELHRDIVRFSKFRSPMNHVSLMFKKSAVLNAGGYKKMMWLEDYYLIIRLIHTGAICRNIQESLVNVRAGAGQLERRRGLNYAKSEFRLLVIMRRLGAITWFQFFVNASLKFSVRLLPRTIFGVMFSLIRRF